MNNIDKTYQELLQDILDNGVDKGDRTGTGTISVFGRQIRHKMSEGFPLLTTKKVHWGSIVAELLWFLRGDTNIKFLLDYNCNIWNGDAYKRYERSNTWELQDTPPMNEFIKRIKEDETFKKTWGELGPIYGRQWRDWNGVDQIQNLIYDLKTNPDSRRLMVNAWNVSDLDQMTLPPCHYGFQVYTRKLTGQEMWDLLKKKVGKEKFQSMVDDIVPFGGGLSEELESYRIPKRVISLMWNQRSVDTFLGLPFNIASYALLLEIIAKEVDMVPDELIGNLGDVHLYKNHIEQAKEQISRKPYNLPTITITERNWYQHQLVKEHLGEKTLDEKLKSYRPDCFELIGYESHPKIKAPLSN
jgi:thymidylate synthase